MSYSWTCPFCKKPTTIIDQQQVLERVDCDIPNVRGKVGLLVKYVVCPDDACNQLSIEASLYTLADHPVYASNYTTDELLFTWPLIPDTTAKIYSTRIVPKSILDDYVEACKIKDLSPKSSATLARRALQGMIRDFWAITKPNKHKGIWSLKNEIEAIKDKVDADVWEAIDAVRHVGNIGAHMEKDVNIIIEVEPGEADQLIGLIETLIEEWYINRYTRKLRMQAIKKIADTKKALKSLASVSSN